MLLLHLRPHAAHYALCGGASHNNTTGLVAARYHTGSQRAAAPPAARSELQPMVAVRPHRPHHCGPPAPKRCSDASTYCRGSAISASTGRSARAALASLQYAAM